MEALSIGAIFLDQGPLGGMQGKPGRGITKNAYGLDVIRVGMGVADHQVDIGDGQADAIQFVADMPEMGCMARIDQNGFLRGADQVGITVVGCRRGPQKGVQVGVSVSFGVLLDG